jgi:release factor glutamine methyltransferase
VNFRSNKIKDIRTYYLSQLGQILTFDESRLMLDMIFESLLDISRAQRLLNPYLRISESELLKIHFAVKQLLRNTPVQYVLKESFFFGLKFFVDERVLIPRPETEELVDWILNNPELKYNKPKILDIGTGSGCIAISVKKNLPDAEVWAMDVSMAALEVARKNAIGNQIDVSFVMGDILSSDQTGFNHEFDVVVSNPPYVRESEKRVMKPNVLDFEPPLALFVSDDDPLVFYKSILRFCETRLKQDGLLYFEINREFGSLMAELLSSNGYYEIVIKADLSGNDRMVAARKL